jgi:hypothetical protein
MDSFISSFNEGAAGRNLGLPLGISSLDYAINGLQRKQIIGIAAAPKVGKSTLALYSFIIHPYLYSLEANVDIDFIIYSLEMSIDEIRYRTAAYFFYHDYGISSFNYKGKTIPISSNYLLGKIEDTQVKEYLPSGRRKRVNIKVSSKHRDILQEIYKKRIEPMFGTYEGHKLIKPGKIKLIIDYKDSNPTGIRNYLLNYARENGTFIFEDYVTENNGQKLRKQRLAGYSPNNPEKYTIILIDHVRKCPIERGFTHKQNIDKLLEYQVQLRNLCGFTFIDIIHLNRNLANVDRMRYSGDRLFPSSEDIKDTGNISEECNIMLTMMNPTDERYKLKNHFGVPVDSYPNYRSLHLVESRDTPSPLHMRLEGLEGVGAFKVLELEENLLSEYQIY